MSRAKVLEHAHDQLPGVDWSNLLESVYHEGAKAVLDGSARTPRDVFDRLKPIYVADNKFKQDFAMLEMETGGQPKKIAKYIWPGWRVMYTDGNATLIWTRGPLSTSCQKIRRTNGKRFSTRPVGELDLPHWQSDAA